MPTAQQELENKITQHVVEHYPAIKAERIASFILENAQIAYDLKRLLELRRQLNTPETLQGAAESIEYITKKICEEFRIKFGVEL